MSRRGAEEISFNLPVSTPGIRNGIQKYRRRGILPGDQYVTIIKPEYRELFRNSVFYVMQGLAAAAIAPATAPDGRTVRAAIFGFAVDFAETGPQTTLVVPNMHELFAPTLEDPIGAIHSFHQGLIRSTNTALEVLEAPFMLAPVPE